MNFLDEIVIIYYVLVNIGAFALMGIDKKKAEKDKWRIKEHTLLVSSLIGGFIGYYIGMHHFHHKTKKMKFHICFFASLVLHGIILYLYFIAL